MSDDISKEVILHLAKAPVLIFLLVAAADGHIDKKEIKQFKKILRDPTYRLLFSAMQEAESNPMDVMLAIKNDGILPSEELHLIRGILDALEEPVGTLYRKLLYQLGKSIAEASGGFLGIFGNKISQAESQALSSIATILGLEEEELNNHSSQEHKADAVQPQYTQLSQLPDHLFPVLKTQSWSNNTKDHVAMSHIFQDAHQVKDEPVIGYAFDSPTTLTFLNLADIGEEVTLDSVHQKALENLENRLNLNSWQQHSVPINEEGEDVKGLVLKGDYFSSEAMLSETILNHAHEALDSDLLMVIAPCRGELYVSSLMSEEKTEPERVIYAGAALSNFFFSEQAPISPNVWIAKKGKIVGHVSGMEEIISIAEKHAEKQAQDEEEKLIHSVTTFESDLGLGINLDIVAHDIDVMLKNLQHVIRGYAQNYLAEENFTGDISVSIDLQDENFDNQMLDDLSQEMDNMFQFLNEQFENLRSQGAFAADVQLKYQWK